MTASPTLGAPRPATPDTPYGAGTGTAPHAIAAEV